MKKYQDIEVSKDLLSGLLFLILGIATLVAVPANIVMVEMEYGVNPRFVPELAGRILIVLSVMLVLKSFVAIKNGTYEKILLRLVLPSIQGLGVLILIFAWYFGLLYFNYLFVTGIVAIAGLLVFQVRHWSNYLIALSFVLITWASFTFLLNVRLP